MADTAATLTRAVGVSQSGTDPLDRLLTQIAAGDRSAFRCLYAFQAMRVWRTASRALLRPEHALAVTRSTFLEVWHTAGSAARYDARDWIAAITGRHIGDRLHALAERGETDLDAPPPPAGDRTEAMAMSGNDTHVRRQLDGVLGAGRATIRIGPANFTRVDNIGDALAAIATAGRRPLL